jgi:restriction system protein
MMLPFLKVAADRSEHSLKELRETLASTYKLSDSELEEMVPSGQQTKFSNRISWVATHLKKAGLIEYTRRGCFSITPRGLDLLNQQPDQINLNTLKQFPEYVVFRTTKSETTTETLNEEDDEVRTPDEVLYEAYQKIREGLSISILEKVKSCSPAFFEKLVVKLLVAMGYGGTLSDAGKAVGKSGDGGIDGIIKEDRLGLDVIFIQAKRWEGTVGRPEIQKFAGALLGNQARKGVFLTTSDFSKEAKEYVKGISSKIILIDGEELAELMIDYDIGVSLESNYEVKKIDLDFFED